MIFPLRCPLSIAGEQLKTENKISAFKCLPRPACKTRFVPVPGICSLPYRPSFNELLTYRRPALGKPGRGAPKCYCFYRGNEPGGLGHLLDW